MWTLLDAIASELSDNARNDYLTALNEARDRRPRLDRQELQNRTDDSNDDYDTVSDTETDTMEHLGDLLTNLNPEFRRKGILTLAYVLDNLPVDFLGPDDLQYLVTFFCDRLKDHHTVIPATLQGIRAIVKMDLPPNSSIFISTTLFQHVQCQQQAVGDRFNLYTILFTLMDKYVKELLSVTPDFVFGVISAIDGERDPRNLMFLFTMLPFFIKTFPLGHLTEEMFEVISCYYPVDFRSITSISVPQQCSMPPERQIVYIQATELYVMSFPFKTDPSSVTREDLASELENCLTAIPDFSELCLPLLMEKLDSSLRIAKLDSLRLLRAACNNFTASALGQHYMELFRLMQSELLPGSDRELKDASLLALSALVRLFSMSALDKHEANWLPDLLAAVYRLAESGLCDVELIMFSPATSVLLEVTRASPAACQVLVSKCNLRGLTRFGCSWDCARVRNLLPQDHGSHQTPTCSSGRNVCEPDNKSHSHSLGGKTLKLYILWQDVFPVFLDASNQPNEDLRRESLKGLTGMAGTLTDESRAQLLSRLCGCITQEIVSSVRYEGVSCLKALAQLYPDQVFKALKDADITPHFDIVDKEDQRKDEQYPCLDEVQRRLECFCHLTLVLAPDTPSEVHLYLHKECDAVLTLITSWIAGVSPDNIHQMTFRDKALIEAAADVIRAIVAVLDVNEQNTLLEKFVPIFIGADPQSTLLDRGKTKFQPLEVKSPPQYSHTERGGTTLVEDHPSVFVARVAGREVGYVAWKMDPGALQCDIILKLNLPYLCRVFLLQGVMTGLHHKADIPHKDTLLDKLLELSVHTCDQFVHTAAVSILACSLNKMTCDILTMKIFSESLTVLSSPQYFVQNKLFALNLLAQMVKALLLSGHPSLEPFLKLLVSNLDHKEVGEQAATSFKMLLQEDKYLRQENHCNIKLFYRQRFFYTAVKVLSCNDNLENHSNYLAAWAYLIQGTPHFVISSDLEKILPRLLSLIQQNSPALLSAVEILQDLLRTKHSGLEPQLQTLWYKSYRSVWTIPRGWYDKQLWVLGHAGFWLVLRENQLLHESTTTTTRHSVISTAQHQTLVNLFGTVSSLK
uniref:MMS19 nucleotide excision repair protein n=1 Tax=Timema poppense TaxID=170557 RepID=A0A7R9D164_TIMPO|nr:unnamed protein product [Timema poppensis]